MLILFVSRVGDSLGLVNFDLMKKDVLYPVHETKTGWGKILIFRYHISSKDGLVVTKAVQGAELCFSCDSLFLL